VNNMVNEEEALNEFAKTSVAETVNNIRDYSKMMIPLTTGLVTAFIAILNLFGGDKTAELVVKIGSNTVLEPAYWLLVSLVFFIISMYPVLIKVTVGSTLSERRFRSRIILWRFSWSTFGSILFVIGLIKIVSVMGLLVLHI